MGFKPSKLDLSIRQDEECTNQYGVKDIAIGTDSDTQMISVWRGVNDIAYNQAEELSEFICDAPEMFRKLELIIGMYAKGIKPSVGFISEVQQLIQKHNG